MLYSSGTTGRPKGVKSALPEGEFAQMSAVGVLGAALFGVGEDSVYLSRRPSTTPPRCGSAWRSTASAGRSSSCPTSTPSGSWPWSSGTR